MIKIFKVLVMLCLFTSSIAQNDMKDLIGRLEKQAVEIDSLKKLIKAEINNRELLRNENNRVKDTLKGLRLELVNLEQFIKEKKVLDSIFRLKIDSISLLKSSISEKEKQIVAERQKGEQKTKEAFENGKNEMLANFVNRYKDQPFDILIKSSTKQSVLQDLQIFEGIPEVRLILADIQKIFFARDLLDAKLDASQIKSIQSEVGQIKRESLVLGKLKEIISNYQSVNDGLKELVEKIIALDKREEVAGMSNEIRKKKFDKILAEVTSYIFNYDFNFLDYPYLTDILVQIIKRKQPNPDADISDLLSRL